MQPPGRRESINGIRVEDHQGLVYSAARRMARRCRRGSLDVDDLVQAGMIGLMHACEKFEPERGFAFSSYAVWWIRQAIQREFHNQSRTIRVPSHLWEAAATKMRAQRPLPPCSISLDAPRHVEGDTGTLLDTVTYPEQESADETASANQRAADVRDALEKLDQKTRSILLQNAAGETFTRIAAGLPRPVSRERTRQLYEAGVRELGTLLERRERRGRRQELSIQR